jgi:hypothetical protein
VSPVRYEVGFYVPEDGILHSLVREHLSSYTYACPQTVTAIVSLFLYATTNSVVYLAAIPLF